jgi:hypothetical protein
VKIYHKKGPPKKLFSTLRKALRASGTKDKEVITQIENACYGHNIDLARKIFAENKAE